MAATAVSCSLMSRGCLNAQHVSVQSAVVASPGGNPLAWDPLQRRQAIILRSRRCSHLSSSSSTASSIALGRNFSQTQQSSRLRLAVPRASGNGDDGEKEEVTENGSGNRDVSNVVKLSETARNMWSQFVISAGKPAVVAVMMALILAQPIEDSFAASSGGRMGGKAFSKPSAPSRSYSGGGGGGRAYSGGGGGGLFVAPPLYGSPYGYSPFGYSPFYGGGYGGGSFVGPPFGGTIILAMIAFATLRAVVGFIRDRFGGGDEDRFDD